MNAMPHPVRTESSAPVQNTADMSCIRLRRWR
jgi:hypothetical protein